jgi:Calcineurin-like phosphoesterase
MLRFGFPATGERPHRRRSPVRRAANLTVVVATSLILLPSAPSAEAAHRSTVVIAAAGDISPNDPHGADSRVARMIRSVIRPDAVLALGDEQYPDGTKEQFLRFYGDGFGVPSLSAITYPVPGNHEYDRGSGETAADPASGYFDYFRRRAAVDPNGVARRAGYYSFDLGAWHLVALNSRDGSQPDAKQQAWLRRDLHRDHHRCDLAYWHHPRWSSGNEHGSDDAMQPFWSLAVKAGVDVVLNGHEHLYERFQRKSARGGTVRDRRSGIGAREFVVGTGGKGGNHGFGPPLPGSQARWPAHGSGDVFGALELVLHPTSYSWRMLNVRGGVVDQGGPVACHSVGS